MRRHLKLRIKHGLDRAAAAVALVALAPLMVPIAAAIKLESPGPVFFRQERLGQDGRALRIFKFRSMVANAEGIDGGRVTRLDSPLVTRFGRFLRTSSLDEIPQFINVLRGEMSLVGPRPLTSESVRPEDRRRLAVRPGCTGLVVVKGRQALSWDQRMALDLWYVDHWSLRLDLEILLKTVPVALMARNVYDASGEMKTRTPPAP